jgi:AcrR family transcriptional regulator
VGLRQPSLYVYFDSKLGMYDAMFADGWRQFLDCVRHDYPSDPRKALAQFVGECVQFSSDDVVRHQLLLQRTIPGFEPSPESFAVAMEFYEFGSGLVRRAGVHDSADIDVFTAIVSGLAHQQVANDPGGTRWVRLADRTVEMFLADVERRVKTGDPPRTRRKTRPV